MLYTYRYQNGHHKKQLVYTLTHCTVEWCWQAFVHQQNTVFRWANMSNFNLLKSTNQCKLSSLLLAKQSISFLSYYIICHGTRWVTYKVDKLQCLIAKNSMFQKTWCWCSMQVFFDNIFCEKSQQISRQINNNNNNKSSPKVFGKSMSLPARQKMDSSTSMCY